VEGCATARERHCAISTTRRRELGRCVFNALRSEMMSKLRVREMESGVVQSRWKVLREDVGFVVE